MMRAPLQALRLALVLVVVTGLLYPLVVTGFAQIAFRDQAEGSLVRLDGRVVGSRLLGQAWDGPEWFYGRPSAAGYDAGLSGGSNLGPTSEVLEAQIRDRADAILDLEGPYVPGLAIERIPVDLLLASGSGLDPHISREAADLQAPRIAAVRGLGLAEVRTLIRGHVSRPPLGLFGEAHVNVLDLNRALERMRGGPR